MVCALPSLCFIEQLLEFMHQLPAFANMTMSVRRELCSVMVFEVVEQAGAVVLEDRQEVGWQLNAAHCGVAGAVFRMMHFHKLV